MIVKQSTTTDIFMKVSVKMIQSAVIRILIRIGVSLGSTLRLLDIDGEFVFLIATQIRVAHEVQLVGVMAGRWRNEVKFHLRGR